MTIMSLDVRNKASKPEANKIMSDYSLASPIELSTSDFIRRRLDLFRPIARFRNWSASRWKFVSSMFASQDSDTAGLETAILDLWLPGSVRGVDVGLPVMPDPVSNLFLRCPKAKL